MLKQWKNNCRECFCEGFFFFLFLHYHPKLKRSHTGFLALHSFGLGCLFTALHLQGMSHVGVHPLWAPPPPEDTLWLSARWCFSANSLLFWGTNKPILQGRSQTKFCKRRKKKKKKRWGGVQSLDALQIIKVSCFSPTHSLLPLLASAGTRSPLVIHWREIHTDANRQTNVCVCVCQCEVREDTTRLAIIQTTHSLQAGRVY